MMQRKIYRLFLTVSYPLIDFILIVFSIMLSYKFYRVLQIGKYVKYEKIEIIELSLSAAFMTVLIMEVFGVYKKKSSVLNVEEIKNVLTSISISFLIFMSILVFGQFALSRYVILFSYVFSLALIIAAKTLLYHAISSSGSHYKFNKKVLIYGAGRLGKTLYTEIVNSPKLGVIPVGFIDDDPEKQGKIIYQGGLNSEKGVAVLGNGEDIKRIRETLNVDEVYLAISNISYEDLNNIVNNLKALNITTWIVPNLYQLFLYKINIKQIGNIPLIQESAEYNKPYLIFKRYFDILSSFMLLIVLSPLFLIIAVIIKTDSKGAVFFKQDRVGRNGVIFGMYKFRTMVAETDPYAVNPLDQDDPRITKVGKFLRKISLDELPQIINVLKGDMSLVGPRPEMPFIAEQYDEVHKERLKILPGITGLWQLSGDRKKAIHENMDYDLYYIKNVSFSLDLAILIETLIFAFRGV